MTQQTWIGAPRAILTILAVASLLLGMLVATGGTARAVQPVSAPSAPFGQVAPVAVDADRTAERRTQNAAAGGDLQQRWRHDV